LLNPPNIIEPIPVVPNLDAKFQTPVISFPLPLNIEEYRALSIELFSPPIIEEYNDTSIRLSWPLDIRLLSPGKDDPNTGGTALTSITF